MPRAATHVDDASHPDGAATTPEVPWWRGKLAGLDFEATGTDPMHARAVQAALVVTESDGQPISSAGFESLINPGVAIPEDATRIHGITTARAEREGMPIAHAIARLSRQLVVLAREGVPLVMMNARYDWVMLHQEAARHGLTIPAELPLLDPVIVDRRLYRKRDGKRTLGELAVYHGVAMPGAHDATSDAAAAIAVMRALGPHPKLAGLTPRALHERQIAWFAAWRNSTNAFWAIKRERRRIRGTWPWGEMPTPAEMAIRAREAACTPDWLRNEDPLFDAAVGGAPAPPMVQATQSAVTRADARGAER